MLFLRFRNKNSFLILYYVSLLLHFTYFISLLLLSMLLLYILSVLLLSYFSEICKYGFKYKFLHYSSYFYEASFKISFGLQKYMSRC